MDSLHAIGFFVSAALAGVGGILLAFLPGHGRRGAALAVTGLGVAGIYASLAAGFAAIVALACYAACALLIARPDYRSVEQAAGSARLAPWERRSSSGCLRMRHFAAASRTRPSMEVPSMACPWRGCCSRMTRSRPKPSAPWCSRRWSEPPWRGGENALGTSGRAGGDRDPRLGPARRRRLDGDRRFYRRLEA